MGHNTRGAEAEPREGLGDGERQDDTIGFVDEVSKLRTEKGLLILATLVGAATDGLTELSRSPRGGLHDGGGALGSEMAKKALGWMVDLGHGRKIATATTLRNE